MGDLVRPFDPQAEVDPAFGIKHLEPFRLFGGALPDGVGQPAHPFGPDANRDFGSRRLPLVGCARLGPIRRQIEAVRPFEPLVKGFGASDARDAVRPELPVRERHDVPHAGLEHETERLGSTDA